MKPEKWAQKKAREISKETGEDYHVALSKARAQIRRNTRDRIATGLMVTGSLTASILAWTLEISVVA